MPGRGVYVRASGRVCGCTATPAVTRVRRCDTNVRLRDGMRSGVMLRSLGVPELSRLAPRSRASLRVETNENKILRSSRGIAIAAFDENSSTLVSPLFDVS